MIPMCIPTYKHPKYDYIDRVLKSKEFETEQYKHPLYYFIYDIDWDSYNYDLYKDKFRELHFVKVPFDEYRTAMKMRKFIQEYMTKEHQDFFWLFDNDCALGARGYDYNQKLMVNLNTNEFLDLWESMPEIHNYAICKPCAFWMGIKHEVKPEKEFGFCKNPVQCVLINNKLLNENGISYTGDTTVAEDMEIAVNCLLKGLKIGQMYNYFVGNVQPMGNSEAAWYNLDELVKRTYEKLKSTGFLTLKTDKKGNLKLSLNETAINPDSLPDLKMSLW